MVRFEPSLRVLDQVRLKPFCSTSEASKVELSDIETEKYLTVYTANNQETGQTTHRKVPKFSDARKLCCNLSKIQTNKLNFRVFHQKDADGIANSEDHDQTAPL